MSIDPILLVEDDLRLAGVLARSLQASGHDVVSVTTGSAAREVLSARAISVAIIDINLPDQTGWELLRWLRARSQIAPKVIVTTAASFSRSRIEELKPDVVLAKPFPIDALIQHIRPRAVAVASPPAQ